MFRFDRNSLVLFNKDDGAKIRLAIGSYTKASKPELADIKITDYCPFGCSFCYQDSTKNGVHASLFDVMDIADRLAAVKCFEVAVGGGEPTMHPAFISIARYFTSRGIVFNFTTKNLTWIKDNWESIKPYCGAFAYSTESVADIRKLDDVCTQAGISKKRVNIHYVMGLKDQSDFELFLIAAALYGFRVTLLGYKKVGRGKEVDPVDYSWWIDSVSKLVRSDMCPTLSIDTTLAAQFDGKLPVSNKLYHIEEGAFSIYIDAVKMKFAESSYHDTNMHDFDDNWRKIYRKKNFVKAGA